MRIIIIGAGKTGGYLAEKLGAEHEVTVVEQRRAQAELLARSLPSVNVVEGDACEPEVLEESHIKDADLVAAVTGDDEDNLVVAMLAKNYGVEKVYARVNHPRNAWLFDAEWGVDVAISAFSIMYGMIEKDLGFGDMITLLKLKSEGVYLDELTLPATATSIGDSLANVSLPPTASVMAILSTEGHVGVARGDTVLATGDQILLLVDGEIDHTVIEDAFGIPADSRAESTEA